MQEEKRTDIREEKELPRKPYEPPKVIFSAHLDDLWAAMGPVQACTFSGSVVGCLPDGMPMPGQPPW